MAKKTFKLTIDTERCKGCMLCIDACPLNTMAVSKGVNKRGMRYVVLEQPDKCTGCGLCAVVCPDCAIEINEEE